MRWVNTYIKYVEQPASEWDWGRAYIPWRVRDFMRWLWYGYVIFPMSEFVRWNGTPPCRIARLWKRPPR